MRAHPTHAEAILWQALRRRKLGVRFKRQCPLFGYIADFYCFQRSLIVEADGSSHHPAIDAKRDLDLKAQGFTTLRFTNHQILTNLPAVLQAIRTHL